MLAERRAAAAAEASVRPIPRAARRLAGYWRTAFAAATIVVFAILVGHYVLVTLPARERDRQLAVQRQVGERQATAVLTGGDALESCLSAADATYATSWDAACAALRRSAGCALPSEHAQPIERVRRHTRETCVKQHAGR
jgi:hypothetical protein